MYKKSFQTLRSELQRLTGFRHPEPIRSCCSDALAYFDKLQKLPLSESKSPFVFAIVFIMSTENYTKIANGVFPLLLDAISDSCFDEAALEEILASLITRSAFLDIDLSLRLLLFTTSEIKSKFPCLEIVSPYLSLHLHMFLNKQDSIAHNAHASFQQFLTYLVDQIKSLDNKQKTNHFVERFNRKYNRSCTTDIEVYKALFVMIINDITGMTLGMPTTFVDSTTLPPEILYDTLEVMAIQTKDLITADHNLSCLFDGTIIHLLTNHQASRFIMIFFETMLPHTLQLFASTLGEFISEIRPKSKSSLLPIYFLHSILLRKNISVTAMLKLSDSGDSIMISLIDALNNVMLMSQPTELIDVVPKPLQLNQMNLDLSLVYCVEMLFLLISDIMTDDNAKILTLKLCKVLNNAIIVSLRYMVPRVVPVIHESLAIYLKAIKKYCAPKITKEAFRIICDRTALSDDHRLPPNDVKLYCLNEKEKMWTPFLNSLITNSPEILEGNWLYVMNGIFSSEDISITPQFANKYETTAKLDILDALLSCKYNPQAFMTEFVVSEVNIFNSIWPRLEVYFMTEIASETFGQNALQVFIDILVKCFNSDTEETLTNGINKIVNHENHLDDESLQSIFTELKNIIQMKFDAIHKGWNSIFESIHPKNCGNSADVLSTQNSIINMVCNDYLSQIDEEYIKLLLTTIFGFVKQDIDINVSLSSMDLIWTVKRSLNVSQERWLFIFKNIVEVFYDPRVVLATSSVTTLFNLLSSNINDITDDIFKELLSVDFMAVFDKLHDNYTSVRMQILNEVSHFICGFWSKCEHIETFYDKILPIVINSETRFSIECKNPELVTSGFDFYQTFFNCELLTERAYYMLLDSLKILINVYKQIKDTNNLLISVFGRTIGRCLEKVGPHFSTCNLQSEPFAQMIVTCAAVFPSDRLVHIVPSNMIQAVEKIFPLDDNKFEPFITKLTDVFITSTNKGVRDLCVSTLVKCFNKSSNTQQLKFFSFCGRAAVYEDAKDLKEVLSTVLTTTIDDKTLYRLNIVLESDDEKLLSTIPDADADSQREFVTVKCSKDISTLVTFYQRFLGENKNETVNANCLETVLNVIKEIDLSVEDPAKLNIFMDFVDNLDEGHENDEKVLRAAFYPCLTLITGGDEVSRQRVQNTLLKIAKAAKI